MFKRRPLQSKSEVWMRNIAMGFLIIYMMIFLIIPVVIVIAGSFHQWNPLNQTYNWIGLDNYIRMFSYPTFWQSMGNTVLFCVVVVFFRVALGLAIAYALNSKLMKHKTLFRTIFYMPTVTPLVAVAYVWKIMYNPQFGLIDNIFGLDINWLFDSQFALPALMVMTIWKDFGYAVILFLSGLLSLPSDCYESAEHRRSECMADLPLHHTAAAQTDHAVRRSHLDHLLPAGLCACTGHDHRRSGYFNLLKLISGLRSGVQTV